MTRIPPRPRRAAALSWDDTDDDDFKDVWLEPLPGESSVVSFLRHVFACAGYKIVRVEQAPTHPVLIIRVVRTTAPKIPEYRAFLRHIRELLRRAGFCLKRDELTVDQSAKTILMAFLWRNSSMDYAAALRQADEDAMEFAGMPL